MRIGIRAHDVKADTFEGLVKEIHNEGNALPSVSSTEGGS